MTNCPFFTVWKQGGGVSTFAHEDQIKAEQEARRLAALNPGTKFFVMAPLASFVTTQFSVERFEPDSVPF